MTPTDRAARFRTVQFRQKAVVRALRAATTPLSAPALERACKVKPRDRAVFGEFLRSLVRRGILVWRQGYSLPASPGSPQRPPREPAPPSGECREGVVLHAAPGETWLVGASGDPIQIPGEALPPDTLPGDRVRLYSANGSSRVQWMRHEGRDLVGVARAARRRVWIEVETPRGTARLLLERTSPQPEEGQVVRARVTRFPAARSPHPEGRRASSELWGTISEILGASADPEAGPLVLLSRYGFTRECPLDAVAAARHIARPLRAADLEGRVDLRDLPMRALGDGSGQTLLHAEPLDGDRIRLLVSVADAAHFVPPGSTLDACASARAASVALDGVDAAMLPERLDADLLNLGGDSARLAITVDLCLDPSGAVTSRRVYESAVQCAGAGGEAPAALQQVARRLAAGRRDRGSVGLDLGGERNAPHGAIWRECVSVANQAVASWMADHRVPTLFRVQPLLGAAPTWATTPTRHALMAVDAYLLFHRPLQRYACLIVHQSLKAAFSGAPPPRSSEQLEREAVRLGLAEWRAAQVLRVASQTTPTGLDRGSSPSREA